MKKILPLKWLKNSVSLYWWAVSGFSQGLISQGLVSQGLVSRCCHLVDTEGYDRKFMVYVAAVPDLTTRQLWRYCTCWCHLKDVVLCLSVCHILYIFPDPNQTLTSYPYIIQYISKIMIITKAQTKFWLWITNSTTNEKRKHHDFKNQTTICITYNSVIL